MDTSEPQNLLQRQETNKPARDVERYDHEKSLSHAIASTIIDMKEMSKKMSQESES